MPRRDTKHERLDQALSAAYVALCEAALLAHRMGRTDWRDIDHLAFEIGQLDAGAFAEHLTAQRALRTIVRGAA